MADDVFVFFSKELRHLLSAVEDLETRSEDSTEEVPEGGEETDSDIPSDHSEDTRPLAVPSLTDTPKQPFHYRRHHDMPAI